MTNFYGCSGLKYEEFSSVDPELNITLEYIAGWRATQDRGSYNSYAQAIFYPVSKEKKSQALMTVVAVKSDAKSEGSAGAVDNAINDLIAKRLKFKEAKVLSRFKTEILGAEAIGVELSYQAAESLIKMNSKVIAFQEKVVVFKKNEKVYTLTYRNAAQEYAEFLPGFTRLVQTFKIRQ